MSSFTPFYNSSPPIFQQSYFPWLQFSSWNAHPLLLLSLKNMNDHNCGSKLQQIEERKTDPRSEQRNKTLAQQQQDSERDNVSLERDEQKNSGRIQCTGRNDYSNILKAFIHLVKTSINLKDKIRQIIEKKGLSITYQRFMVRIRRKFAKGKTYISPTEISQFLTSCNQSNDVCEKSIGFVFKIILRSFLSIQYILSLIKSFKGKKQSRKDLIMKTRQLQRIIFHEISLMQKE